MDEIKTEFTPGNWVIKESTSIAGVNMDIVSDMGSVEATRFCPEICTLYNDEDINQANANLISAAPDLLSACEALANGLELSEGSAVPCFLQKAINKARGITE